MEDYMTIKQASEYLHISQDTLRRWERLGKITPYRTTGNHRRYTKELLDESLGKHKRKQPIKLTIGYCRVSSGHQKEDLKRQINVVQTYCEKQGYQFKIIKDIGSGLNYHKKGLNELIHLICTEQCERVVINYQDRLVRFGFDLIKQICEEHHVDLVIINQSEDVDFNQELVDDVLSIITVYSAKLYGKRSHQNVKIVNTNKKLFDTQNS